MKLDVVRPLLPSPHTPRRPPAVVVEHSSLVMIRSDLHTQNAAAGAHWRNHGNSDQTHPSGADVCMCLNDCQVT